MNLVKWLVTIEPMVRARDWNRIEGDASHLARRKVQPDILIEIESRDLQEYQTALKAMLDEATVVSQGMTGVRGLYWEFDLDNEWQSGIDLCGSFSLDDPDWTANTLAWVAGPSEPAFAQIFAISRLSDEEGQSAAISLIGRTLAAFGRALDMTPDRPYPVAASFHGSSCISHFSRR